MLNLATLSLLLAVLLDVAAAVPAPAAAANISLGSRLDRQYTGYVAQPLTAVDARSAGWFPMEFNAAPSDKCNRHVGSPWVFNKATPGTLSQDHPVILFYSAAGQISGIAVAIMGADGGSHAEWTEAMRVRGYLSNVYPTQPDGTPIDTITVGLRDVLPDRDLCDERTVFTEVLGTTLILNPAGPSNLKLEIPLSVDAANAEGYRRGSCFNGMGFHHFKDWKAENGTMSWKAANLVPVVPMYDLENGSINAIFFASAIVQQSIFPPAENEWEPVPLPNELMCGNFCDADCTFAGTIAWSTM
jgi:hypothetical protein